MANTLHRLPAVLFVAAFASLSGLIFGKSVTVEFSKRDRYGRIVGRVLLTGRDINLEQVRSGYAWHYKQYEREQTPAERKAYAEAETEAQKEKRGLWRDVEPVPPWEYRKERRGR
jgi:endonuclease YncB( thermonuclease family)